MSGPTRRTLLLGLAGAGTGIAGTGLGLYAFGRAPGPGGSARAPQRYSGELRTVALAAALENQAVSVHQAARAALHSGRLGPLPPALSAFVQAATAHHTAHAATWNAILRAAGEPPVTTVPLTTHAQALDAVRAARSPAELAAALQRTEAQAAQTHTLAAAGLPPGTPALTAAATIAPVEAMHAATLACLLGGRSTVADFLATEDAVPVTALTV
ncbi:ferritin-like domain-containing protein [Kitasatospora viridis]|uniref:Ferritin-like protein n=1 Tax=Kitasatospora viridis TaxID=281105 RepID=A0A561TV54_9ACTN|nr:ferritin-like domain-containing protein [Kitasatospora viridis]TWF90996.1 ferritin-like protein [Kitasatospora viridis]